MNINIVAKLFTRKQNINIRLEVIHEIRMTYIHTPVWSSSSSSDVVPESEGLSSCPPTGRGLSSVSSEDEASCWASDIVSLGDGTRLTSGDVVFATTRKEGELTKTEGSF